MYSKKRRQNNYDQLRRSSLQVNLSFTSDLSNTCEESDELKLIDSKQKTLDQNVKELREAILNKTREIFNHQNDFCRKTATVLAGPSGFSDDQNDQNQSNSQENEKPHNSKYTVPINSSLIVSSSSSINSHNKNANILSPTMSISSDNERDAAIGLPITCSTFRTDNDVAINAPITESSNKPTIRSIRSCYISLERIDGFDRSKNLKQISMDLTPVQGTRLSRHHKKDAQLMDLVDGTRGKVSIRSSLQVGTSLDRLSTFSTAIGGENAKDSTEPVRPSLGRNVNFSRTGVTTPLDELQDTIILDTSCSAEGPIIQDSSDENEKIFPESDELQAVIRQSPNAVDQTSPLGIVKTITQKRKRKLFTQLNDSRPVSLSPPANVEPSPAKSVEKHFIKQGIQGRRRKGIRSKKIRIMERDDDESNDEEGLKKPKCKVRFPKDLNDKNEEELKKTKKRKVVSKKIVVKKRINPDVLNFFTQPESDAGRDSLNDFTDSKRLISKSRQLNKSIYIVTTGLCNGDKDLVKEAVKKIGGAKIEGSVTRNTTHIVTTGVRTINLLRGIIRGCWLLSLAWIKESLRNQHWQEPDNYEIPHFSKAVQENRKDREIFGRSYVPELFATCGLIYIDTPTSPPRDILRELIKTAGGRIIQDIDNAKIVIGGEDGIREVWVLDSITTGQLQPIDQYRSLC